METATIQCHPPDIPAAPQLGFHSEGPIILFFLGVACLKGIAEFVLKDLVSRRSQANRAIEIALDKLEDED